MTPACDQGTTLRDTQPDCIYQALRKAHPAPASENFKPARQQWVLDPDASCALIGKQYNQYDGTMYLPMRTATRVRPTEHRACPLTLLLDTQKEHDAP